MSRVEGGGLVAPLDSLGAEVFWIFPQVALGLVAELMIFPSTLRPTMWEVAAREAAV